jgi:choline dehydrogenase-like flavoprotein
MALYTSLPENIHEVDIIIAGGEKLDKLGPCSLRLTFIGGTAGCVVAARLAEASPDLFILVIERGTNNSLPSVIFPAFVFNNLITDANTMILHHSMPERQLNNRSVVVESGGVLGGGSSVNMMTYSRPQRSDIDSWAMKGWSMDEMLPFFKKVRKQPTDTPHTNADRISVRNISSSGPELPRL